MLLQRGNPVIIITDTLTGWWTEKSVSMARNYEKRFSGLNRFLEAKEKGEHYKPSLHHHFSMFNSFHRGWEVRKPEATVGMY